jgi:phenylalanyl-tRNA synthetase beta chain
VTVEDPEHCPRYAARVIKDVSIGPSPFWLTDRLTAAGVRPINNIVDVTNFVMLEYGQPLHAFDLDQVAEARIVVKLAESGDRFTTLDGVERVLGPEMLMICDGQRPVGVAGVMGGLNSEIGDRTRNVLLESAYFSPISIRRTARRLGLSTEASYRFERGIDPDKCREAADRAAALMADLAGGRVLAGAIDRHPRPHRPAIIEFRPDKCNQFLGADHSPAEMAQALRAIEIQVDDADEPWRATAPSFRPDLEREVDLFEEVARLMGYDRVPTTLPASRLGPQPLDPTWILRNRVRAALEASGFNEIISYTFIPDGFQDKLGLADDDPKRDAVRILNPLSEEQALMRTSMAHGLLDTLRRNQSHGVTDVALYEIGLIYSPRPGRELPEERLTVGGVLAGSRTPLSWHHKPENVDFYDLKGAVETLLAELDAPRPSFAPAGFPAYYQHGAAASIACGDTVVGWLGRVGAQAAQNYGLRSEAFLFELDLKRLGAALPGLPVFKPLPRFPSVNRDLSIRLDRDVPAGRVIDFIRDLGEDSLIDVTLFDAYEGEKVRQGQKSLAFRLEYRDENRTLTDEEVNQVHQRIMDRVLPQFSAELQS